MFTHDLLADPNDSIQFSIEVLAYQKELFEKEIPYIFDKELMRVNGAKLKETLVPLPGQCLNKLYLSLPLYLENLSNGLNKYLNESIIQLTKSATNVADFVEQMKNLKKIDRKIPKVKDRVGFIGQICNII